MGRLGLWVSLCRISIFFRLKDRSQTWGSEHETKTNQVLQFQACATLLRLHHWGHSHTYLQYLINGRKIPSESTWKIFTLPGIILCCILAMVPQAQGCCLSKKGSIFEIPTHWDVLVTLWCFVQVFFKAIVLSGMQQKLWQNNMSKHQFKWHISFLTSRMTPAAFKRISFNCSVARREEWEWTVSEDCKKG